MPDELAYTVVIPAWNVERYVGEALRSIVGQSLPPVRIVVVDDGSTDGTADVARSFGDLVEVIRQPNQGQGRAMTVGMARVTTPFTAFIDADDIWLPGKMETQFACLKAGELDVVFAHVCLMNDGHPPDFSRTQENWSRTTMLMRTAVFRRVGDVLDMPALHGEMVDWVARARGIGVRMEMMPDVLSVRRIREGSLTYRRGGERGYLAAAKSALDRRRALAALAGKAQ